ncbi:MULTISPECIES: AmmeMemoRadiSam system protein B [unclassified Fusibacter]|uniref:AmmeMemoRadiSam system protein B n=1 Tax=unclassified Fusibacter TaxID=2624464 RepID=UPI0010107242|nr:MULTISPECIES: AmmeMemoRadiSam system protein B [unclassified Fusibacter]MCK8060351.1 AmmeMemoRadiSam system protein B [Fusibacter sp. A2]NPE20360.1 AmmeMemoRadiSam system protein B [Fusibacter sp. A1]RXV63566.1 AmmeMemoRadiSam system protein B [Fusibacter sp. A1]
MNVKRKSLVLAVICTVAICLLRIGYGWDAPAEKDAKQNMRIVAVVDNEIQTVSYPAPEYLQLMNIFSKTESLDENRFETLEIDKKQIGMILPHHLLAGHEILKAYREIADFDPELIILMSPNHQGRINAPILSRKEPLIAFDTIFLMDDCVLEMENKHLIRYDKELLLLEHGIYNHLPFLSEVGFDAPILTLVVARNTSVEQLDAVHAYLNDYTKNKKVLWIASIDFSHYLPAAMANTKDDETMEWIENRNYEAIAKSTSDHLDAPGVLRLWLKQFENTKLLWHSNSAEISDGFHDVPGTSYLIYYGE